MSTNDTLTRLQKWYSARCNGDWEHQHGVDIGTLDNPGWLVKVSLVDTPLQDKPFSPIERKNSEDDWIHCKVEGQLFNGAGGSLNLEEILELFLDWADQPLRS